MKVLSVERQQYKHIDKRISQQVMVSEWAELLSGIQNRKILNDIMVAVTSCQLM